MARSDKPEARPRRRRIPRPLHGNRPAYWRIAGLRALRLALMGHLLREDDRPGTAHSQLRHPHGAAIGPQTVLQRRHGRRRRGQLETWRRVSPPNPPAPAPSASTSLTPRPMELGAIAGSKSDPSQCARCKGYGHWSSACATPRNLKRGDSIAGRPPLAGGSMEAEAAIRASLSESSEASGNHYVFNLSVISPRHSPHHPHHRLPITFSA